MQKKNDDAEKKHTVLIVDPSIIARRLAVHTFQKMGVSILQSDDGLEGLELLKKHPETSLLIIELVMPGLNADKFMKLVREFNATIPVITVAGPPIRNGAFLAFEQPDLFIPKPYNPFHLLQAARMFMGIET